MEELELSKTKKKERMHELQRLGEALVELPPARLAALPLPEALASAVREAKRIRSRGAHRRQIQYIGRLMREVDADPIRAALKKETGA